MKRFIFRAIFLFALSAHAEPGDVPGNVDESAPARTKNVFVIGNHEVTRIEATKALLAGKRVQKVHACDAVLTSKLTIQCKKVKKFENVAEGGE